MDAISVDEARLAMAASISALSPPNRALSVLAADALRPEASVSNAGAPPVSP